MVELAKALKSRGGRVSLREVSAGLAAQGYVTPRGKPYSAEALAACRVHGATLIIARLDRLARNVAFVSNLMEAGVDFEAIDFPAANRLTVHILAAVAEHEEGE
jgi:hypothetical protein